MFNKAAKGFSGEATPSVKPMGSIGNMNNMSNVSAGKPKRGVTLSRKWLVAIVVVIGALMYGMVHYYNKYQSLTVDPNLEAQKVTNTLVTSLGRLIELPTDETPTVATISDREKLSSQTFFTNAENGDILFAYTNAMKAILYRPSTNKIINVAPISINQPQSLNTGTKQGAAVPVPATTQIGTASTSKTTTR